MSRIASISSNATLCSKISFPIPDVYLNYKILLLVLRMRENCVRNRVAFEDLLSCPKICNNELRSFEFHISQNWVVLFFSVVNRDTRAVRLPTFLLLVGSGPWILGYEFGWA